MGPDATPDDVRLVPSQFLTADADLHLNYRPGHWVPHVSVATRARGPQLATVTKAVADVLPLAVVVDRAALVDSAIGEFWVLDGIP